MSEDLTSLSVKRESYLDITKSTCKTPPWFQKRPEGAP